MKEKHEHNWIYNEAQIFFFSNPARKVLEVLRFCPDCKIYEELEFEPHPSKKQEE